MPIISAQRLGQCIPIVSTNYPATPPSISRWAKIHGRETPDDERSQLETGARDIGLRFNTNGTWNIRKGWLSNVKYTLSGSYRDKHSYQKKLLGNAFAAYSMSNTDGAVLSNRPGQKVYDNEGRELTNIPAGEASLIATYLPNEYFSRYDIYGKEVNLFANLNASFSKTLGAVNNRILLGTNFRSDGNLGDGKVYDPYNPPNRSQSAENSSPRPRKYSSIPFINQLSLYGGRRTSPGAWVRGSCWHRQVSATTWSTARASSPPAPISRSISCPASCG